jgi:hypothetical protein
MTQSIERARLQPSDEINDEQIALAKAQGAAFQRAVDHMTRTEAHGVEQRAGFFPGWLRGRARRGHVPPARWTAGMARACG